MSIVYTNNLDMHSGGVPLIVHLGQYDSDFSLVFNLYSSVGALTIESGTTAEIRGTKSDGFGYSADATIDIVNKKVTVAGSNQMTAAARQNNFELVLLKNNKVLSSANFILDVEHAALDADTIQDESVLKELNAIIAGAATATQAASDAAASAAAAAESARTLTIDNTLTHQGQAADAKKVGDEITALKDDLEQIVPGLSEEAKEALLACFRNVAWIGDDGQDYYDALEAALDNVGFPKIIAVFNQGGNIIYNDTPLDSLKQYLTVTYYETAESAGEVVAGSEYTISGTLDAGVSTVFVIYNNLSTSFAVNVIERTYIWNGQEDASVPQKWIDKNQIVGLNDPRDYTLVNGYNVKSYIYSAGAYPQETTYRATSRNQIIVGELDGKTIGLSNYVLSSGATINYGIWYGYINPSNYSFNGTQYIEQGTDNVFVFGKWLGASIVLPTNTSKAGKRFLMVGFKLVNETRDFTIAELEEIPSLITIS